MKLFQRISPPRNANVNLVKKVQWFSYTDDFYLLLPVLKRAAKQHGAPFFIYTDRAEYNYSFHVGLANIDPGLVRELNALTKALINFGVGSRLNFFDGLINKRVSGDLFHFLFSFLRASLIELQKDDMASLYPPQTVTKNEDDFPLHCDLYIPKILFNVFEESAPGQLGGSLFVSTKNLLDKYLPSVGGVKKSTVRKAMNLLRNEKGKDRYEDFYSLLYDDANAWSDELKKTLYAQSLFQKFVKGQGYMINDRTWMHGRGTTQGKMNAKRLHRLVFNNKETVVT